MNTRKAWLFVVGALVCSIVLMTALVGIAPAAALQTQGPPPGLADFIVTLHSGVSPEGVAREHGIAPRFIYHSALNGFSATLSELAHARLLGDVRVRNIEIDQIYTEAETEPSAPWGLDRIDQRALPLDTQYTYSGDGTGVTAYMIGGGIRYTHSEFGGRVTFGFDAYGDGGNDCSTTGHGTRVAGVLGGRSYGVAKNVNLVVVKVNNCAGTGLTTSTIVAGVDWIITNHVLPAVANLSIEGSPSVAMDAAIHSMMSAGVVTTVAAGNSNDDACNHSPSRITNAMTIGSSDASDVRAATSSWGTCVDWFAPGVDILAASNVDDTSISLGSGTSFAAPFVGGVAAIFLQSHPSASQIQVRDALLSFTSKGKVTSSGTPNNHVLFNAEVTDGAGDYTSPTTLITSPPNGATLQKNKSLAIQASASDNVTITKVEFYIDGVLKCTDPAAPFSCNWIVPNTRGATYVIQSKAFDAAGNAQASPFVSVVGN